MQHTARTPPTWPVRLGRGRLWLIVTAGLVVIGAWMGLPPMSAHAESAQLALQVTPATELTGGEHVTVDGQGFVINGEHRVLQCLRGAAENGFLHEDRCDASTTVAVTADSQGSFATPFTVAATITIAGTPVSCVVIGECELDAVYATNSGPPAVGAPIELANAQLAPTTTTTTTAVLPGAMPTPAQPAFTG